MVAREHEIGIFFKKWMHLLHQTEEKTDDENESNEPQCIVTPSSEQQLYSRFAKMSGQITRRKYSTNKVKSIQTSQRHQ